MLPAAKPMHAGFAGTLLRYDIGMRLDRFTERSQEALQAAQQAASALQHARVEPEHLLLALLRQEDGLVPSLLQRLEVPPQPLAARLEERARGAPQAVGGGEPAVGDALREVLMAAFDEMSRLKDEYVSTEHLLLALAGRKGGEAVPPAQRRGGHPRPDLRDAGGGARLAARHRPEPRGQVRRPRQVRPRPHRRRARRASSTPSSVATRRSAGSSRC